MPASFVLGSQTSSTYPKGTPPVFALLAASLSEHFEQPAQASALVSGTTGIDVQLGCFFVRLLESFSVRTSIL